MNKAQATQQQDQEEMFMFLDVLRETGMTNMFGAGSYLEEQFELSKQEARAVLAEWMRTFGERHSQVAQ